MSALSFANSSFSLNARNLIDSSLKAENPDYITPMLSTNSSSGEPTSSSAATLPGDNKLKQEAHSDALKRIIFQTEENTNTLAWLSLSRSQLKDCLEDNTLANDNTADQIIRVSQWSVVAQVMLSRNDTVVGLVHTYLLPLMCALRGAAAYGLRYLSEQTRAKTFRASHTAYARAILAVIVGFAVGLFSTFFCC